MKFVVTKSAPYTPTLAHPTINPPSLPPFSPLLLSPSPPFRILGPLAIALRWEKLTEMTIITSPIGKIIAPNILINPGALS